MTEIESALIDQTALTAIEAICGDDFCEDMSSRVLTNTNMDPNLEIAIEKLTDIYRLAHSHVKSHSCWTSHADWRNGVNAG